MIGEHSRFHHTIQIPSWDPLEDHHLAGISSPVFIAATAAGVDSFLRYLPSADDFDAVDGYSSDHFRMFEFKIRKCARARSHDWTDCPYAHSGEKARRRDPKMFHYSGTPCPDFRKGNCKKGESCDLAHGIFECWLHPTRYRTQPCKDGTACRRRVCFFAHTPDQLRLSPTTAVPGESVDGFSRNSLIFDSFATSPTSILSNLPADSPPVSPAGEFNSLNQLVSSMRRLQFEKTKSTHQWGGQLGEILRSPTGGGFFSSPAATPTAGNYELWGKIYEEEPVMERVESGKNLRAKMYAKLGKDNSVEGAVDSTLTPDVGWISELLV